MWGGGGGGGCGCVCVCGGVFFFFFFFLTRNFQPIGFSGRSRNERPEPLTRNMKGFQFLGAGGNRSVRRKPSKAGMESAN